jgi:hypothetical protein
MAAIAISAAVATALNVGKTQRDLSLIFAKLALP